MKTIMPKVSEILEEKEENCGDFIGNNLINQGLNNIFTNDMLDNDTSLLIWDCLFLEGNFVLIKSILALYACLEPILVKSKRNIESFKRIIDVDLRNIKPDNDEFINYMFIKQYTFDEEYINEERLKYSIQISEGFDTDKIDNTRNLLLTIPVLFIGTFIAAIFEDILSYIALLGGFFCSIMCFMIPGFLMVLTNEGNNSIIKNIIILIIISILCLIGFIAAVLTVKNFFK
jgi:hypothetical protein